MFIVYAIIIFCILIFVHEAGHFFAAKLCGVKVNEFALGMGPKIFSKQGKETKYSLRALPIGGYCAMEGEDEDSSDPKSFTQKNMGQKALILIAGSLMNFLFALIVISMIVFSVGDPTLKIKDIEKGSPAAKATLASGDVVKAVNGKSVDKYVDFQSAVLNSEGKELSLTIDRNGAEKTIAVTPAMDKKTSAYRIGVSPKISHSPLYFLKSFGLGMQGTLRMAKMMYDVIAKLLTGRESVKQLSGPVGIVKIIGDSSKEGFVYIANIAALISLNLAIFNMLPFPALDGGRVLFLFIRKITGKKMSSETEGKIHFAGLVLLFMLMIYVTFNDVIKLAF